jgi:CheY-like chemotaxis protein
MKTILVIEDEHDILTNTLEVLQLENFEAIGAPNGMQGLQLAQTLLPDLILCDIRLPGIDGYEVLKRLQENPQTAVIPFVFMSSNANKDDIRTVKNMGIDYLVKPFSIDGLLTVLHKHLGD